MAIQDSIGALESQLNTMRSFPVFNDWRAGTTPTQRASNQDYFNKSQQLYALYAKKAQDEQQANIDAINRAYQGVGLQSPFSTGGVAGTGAADVSADPWKQGGAANQFTTIANTKNPAVQSRIDTILGDWDKTRTDLNTRLGNIGSEVDTAKANIGKYNTQEGSVIGQFYDGTIQKRLDDIASARAKAIGDITNRIAMENQGDINRRQLLGSTTGSSAYLDRIKSNALSKIYQAEAEANANQQLANLQWLASLQGGLLGKRASAEQMPVAMSQIPIQLQMAINQGLIGNLGQASNIDLQNMFYGVQQPYASNFTTAGVAMPSVPNVSPAVASLMASSLPNYGTAQTYNYTPNYRAWA